MYECLHCKKKTVKFTVKLPAAVPPTKYRKIYGYDYDNRKISYMKKNVKITVTKLITVK